MCDEIHEFKSKLVNNHSIDFERFALQLFQFQAQHCQIYKKFISHLDIDLLKVSTLEQVPFMPISFFKGHKISSTRRNHTHIFESSGTTGATTSKHYVYDLPFYLDVAQKGFENLYGDIRDYCVIGLLPSYLERNNSSLIAMVDHFIKLSDHNESGFYLNNFDALAETLKSLALRNQKTLLIGVTFGLLDFASGYPSELTNITIMETGGMKGRRKELTRQEVHDELKSAFSQDEIHSEYGMTELFSQAYAPSSGLFLPSYSMKVLCRDLQDPLSTKQHGRGGLNIIDLANIDSCAFIATEDQGRVYENGSFEVLGRIDHTDVRGCNLMVADLT